MSSLVIVVILGLLDLELTIVFWTLVCSLTAETGWIRRHRLHGCWNVGTVAEQIPYTVP